MKTEHIRKRVESATVSLTKMRGRGVLVPGGFILTAAHCVEWAATGLMALGEQFLEPIKTRDGRKFLAEVAAVEPANDIAILQAADNQVLSDEAAKFEEFAESVEGVPLLCKTIDPWKAVKVQVFTHTQRWVVGKVTRYGAPGRLPDHGSGSLITESRIRPGTSGSPVVDYAGRLIGVISNSNIANGSSADKSGSMPFAYLSLPKWAMDKIQDA